MKKLLALSMSLLMVFGACQTAFGQVTILGEPVGLYNDNGVLLVTDKSNNVIYQIENGEATLYSGKSAVQDIYGDAMSYYYDGSNENAYYGDPYDMMTHTVDETAAVAHFLFQDALQVVLHLVVAVPVLHVLHDVVHHLAHLVIGAAVTIALEGADGRRDGGVDIRVRRRKHASRERRVVAAAVLRMEHHAQVEQLGFLAGEAPVLADGIQDGFRRVMLRLERVEKHGLLIEMTALHLIGVGHDGRHTGNKRNALAHIVFEGEIIGVVVVGIERQHGAGQLVHHVLGGILHDDIFREILRQLAVFVKQLADAVVLTLIRQFTENQQPDDLLVGEAAFAAAAGDDIRNIHAAVGQAALIRHLVTVVDQIAVDIADVRQTGHDAGAVPVAQTALDAVVFIFILADDIVGAIFCTKLTDGGTGITFIDQSLHIVHPFRMDFAY